MSDEAMKIRIATDGSVVNFHDLTVYSLQNVLMFLQMTDVCNAARTCKAFYAAYKLPGRWALENSKSYILGKYTKKTLRENPSMNVSDAHFDESIVEVKDGWLHTATQIRSSEIPVDLAAGWCGITLLHTDMKDAKTFGSLSFVMYHVINGKTHCERIKLYVYA